MTLITNKPMPLLIKKPMPLIEYKPPTQQTWITKK